MDLLTIIILRDIRSLHFNRKTYVSISLNCKHICNITGYTMATYEEIVPAGYSAF